MPRPVGTEGKPSGDAGTAETRRHLRGSALLLAGRLIALVIEFAAHVLVVRYLTKTDFGAFSYALAIVSLLSQVIVLGLPETLARYAPMFIERREYGKLIGSGVVAVSLVLGLGLIAMAAIVALSSPIGDLLDSDYAATLLAILILIVPSEGINLIFQGVFAALDRVRVIFIRQYVLVPALRLLVAIALVRQDQDATFLAVGYVAVSVIGLLWYGSLGGVLLRSAARDKLENIEFPTRELLSFALPVLVTNIFWVVLLATSTITLGVMAGTTDVAEFQAVLPPARLNYLVTTIFSIMFIPTISRMFARGQMAELRAAYMSTTYWLTVLTVPLLVLTTVFAPAFVPAFFGDDYDASILVLALLSAGYFLHSTAGPNSTTLKVFRKLRYTVVIDLLALATGVGLNLVLVPLAQANGAALAFLLAVLCRNAFYQWALRRIAGIELLTPDFLRLQAVIAFVVLLLAAVQFTLAPGLAIAVALSAAAGVAVLRASRRVLDIAATFPELTRGPLGRFLAP